ncbi:SAM-dependent methyltransferase [Peristeroidobacter soli]|uniref:SAM-dependent methyltransferase n=1 Tax=Peristeroidobacter soli TaxID=2497877 RepID=UPI00101C59A5|nr:cyclopropane-fatty-acyl-phospholipid synthase family protein [Peristeroidobacter soli]
MTTARPSILPNAPALVASDSWLQRTGRNALLGQLKHLKHGEIAVVEGGEVHRFGKPTPECSLSATVEVVHPQFWADAAFGGTTGAGEAYIHGHWRSDDLTALVRIMVLNREIMQTMEGGLAFLTSPLRRIFHWMNRNSKDGSRKNIAAHYDLGNDFFQLFLDDTMAYSCGIFEAPEATLKEASLAKFEAVCRKLQLKPSDHLVEIGTGWGGLAIYAAKKYGCRVTTTTISKEQYALAKERVAAEGLNDRIDLRLDDYRDLAGQYDKLVSIEMIEAVGHQFLDTYIAKCASLLKPNGAMLIQAITIQDQIYNDALKSVDFIQRFVFPGSFIPCVTAITDAVTRSTDMKVYHLEDIGPHYATTLRMWRENFFANIGKVRALGYPEEFIRLWDYYLCYCEGGFAERQLGDVHMLMVKPGWRG